MNLAHEIKASDLSESDINRFWSKVVKSDGCWEWTGGLFRHSYGRFKFGGKDKKAHCVSYAIANGVKPGGNNATMQVMHLCNNGKCVNPEHLKLGDAKENWSHRIGAGTHGYKYGEDVALKVVGMLNAGHTYSQIKSATGVSKGLIWAIKKNGTWAKAGERLYKPGMVR
jgi:hypothetical protein